MKRVKYFYKDKKCILSVYLVQREFFSGEELALVKVPHKSHRDFDYSWYGIVKWDEKKDAYVDITYKGHPIYFNIDLSYNDDLEGRMYMKRPYHLF